MSTRGEQDGVITPSRALGDVAEMAEMIEWSGRLADDMEIMAMFVGRKPLRPFVSCLAPDAGAAGR